jgi:predicted Zn-dependent protease
MDVRGRPDRSGIRRLKIGSRGGDLIEDIHRQHRRRILKRAAQFTALVLALLAAGFAFKVMADRRARSQALEKAQQHFVGGTVSDVRAAVDVLGRSLQADPNHGVTQATHALMRAHLWTEFGSDESEAREAVEALSQRSPTAALAAAYIAFGDGDLDAARSRLEAIDELEDDSFFEAERLWLTGMLTAAMQADDEAALAAAIAGIDELVRGGTGGVAHRRVHALLLLLAGDDEKALTELGEARKASRSHMGLAADEAYYNAYLHQELAGVASVADQLLATPNAELSPRDRAHVLLARAVVHVRSGETSEGLSMLDEAWPGLAEWSAMARELAIQTALEAADDTRFEAWLEQTPLPASRADTYRAWAKLVRGDVMTALENLASLPQDDPWVAFLQALALVEQHRFEEAQAWVQRVQKIMPGRDEIDVAAARIELRLGDEKLALSKLAALAEEEPYAPRAYTGLGEAYLLQKEDVEERKAKKAFEKAIDREAAPAEAMLQLAKLLDARRKVDPEAERQALELMEKAAKANPYLPRYSEALALYSMELGYEARARELLAKLKDVPGVSSETVLALVELEIAGDFDDAQIEALLERGAALGAKPLDVERLRARHLMSKGTKEDAAAAEDKLAALLDEHPADVETRVLYARALLTRFDRKTAESAIRKGFSTTPDDRHGRLYLAWADLENRTGKRKTAAPRARSAWLKMLEEDRPARELLTAADLATRLWVRQQQNRVALTIAKQLTSRLAFHGDAWTIRAQTELAVSEAAAARESAERAIDLDKDNPRAHAILGHALLRFGYKDRARESYERAIELVVGTSDEKEYRDNLRRL